MLRKKWFLFLNIIFIISIFIIGFNETIFDRDNSLSNYHDNQVIILGMVCEETDQGVDNQKLTICVRAIKLDNETKMVSGRVLVSLGLYPSYNYGDFLLIKGYLKKPIRFEDFKYDRYLARYHIYSVIYYPQIKKDEGKLNLREKMMLKLFKFKWSLKEMIDRNLPEPEAGLANAVLLGYKRTVEKEDMEIFSRVGLSHMIAISGSHITIMSAMIINLFVGLGLNRKRALVFVWIFLVLYPLITGLQASAVRSAIMGAFGFLSIYSIKKIPIFNCLIFSASLMLLFNPKLLRDDVGFQLSFLAVLGIIYLYPIGEKIIGKRIKNKVIKSVWDVTNLTLVSQIITLPILLINFNQLSIISPLANILVLWVFSMLLAGLIIAIFFSFILPWFSLIFFWPIYLLLKFVFLISNYLANISWAAMDVNNFTWFKGIIYYLVLLILFKIYSSMKIHKVHYKQLKQ